MQSRDLKAACPLGGIVKQQSHNSIAQSIRLTPLTCGYPPISIFESWPIRKVTTPGHDKTGPPALRGRASFRQSHSLIQPMAYGPPKPPRLPIEFINAMPPAAAEPVRKPVGEGPEGAQGPHRTPSRRW